MRSPSETKMESVSSPLRLRIVKLVNFGKMPNEKDNERESSITPRSMLRRSRTGRWYLNNSGRRNSNFEHSEINSDFSVVGKPTLCRDLEKLQSSIFR